MSISCVCIWKCIHTYPLHCFPLSAKFDLTHYLLGLIYIKGIVIPNYKMTLLSLPSKVWQQSMFCFYFPVTVSRIWHISFFAHHFDSISNVTYRWFEHDVQKMLKSVPGLEWDLCHKCRCQENLTEAWIVVIHCPVCHLGELSYI